MREFIEIEAIAAQRKGGDAALQRLLDTPTSPADLAKQPLSNWLEAMARAIFQAGFSWSVIEAKWPGFQKAFDQFDVNRVAFYRDEDTDRLLSDKAIVRNGAKIASVIDNARFLLKLEGETGDASRYIADWPAEDHSGLVDLFARKGSRLGGLTGQRVLRVMGKDGFVLSLDVCRRLVEEGVIDKPPSSKRAMTAVQAAFNAWHRQSGRPLTQISQILAMSVS